MQMRVNLDSTDPGAFRRYYDHEAYEALGALWASKGFIVAVVSSALLLAALYIVMAGQSYRAESIIELGFVRAAENGSATAQTVAAVDASSMVESAAQVLRSRPIARAVVSRLGLDKDPVFAREPLVRHLIREARVRLNMDVQQEDPDELAIDELMRRVRIATEPRSYLISISMTSHDARRSAEVANAVAIEFFRSEELKLIAEARSAVGRELSNATAILGDRHPALLQLREKASALDQEYKTLRDSSGKPAVVRLAGRLSFLPAEEKSPPAMPNWLAILVATAVVSSIGSIWFCLFRRHRIAARRRLRLADAGDAAAA